MFISDRGEPTKTNIQLAFWKLYEKKPIGKISVKEVCDKAGYSRYTFYRYFKDIYDVLDQIEADLLEQTDRLYLSVLDRYRENQRYPTVDDMVWVSEESYAIHYTSLPVLFGSHGDPKFREAFCQRFAFYLKAYFPDYFSDESMETDLLAEFFTSGFIGALDFLGRNSDRITFRQMVTIIYDRLGISKTYEEQLERQR